MGLTCAFEGLRWRLSAVRGHIVDGTAGMVTDRASRRLMSVLLRRNRASRPSAPPIHVPGALGPHKGLDVLLELPAAGTNAGPAPMTGLRLSSGRNGSMQV